MPRCSCWKKPHFTAVSVLVAPIMVTNIKAVTAIICRW